jgi:diacylglycerol kinase family enzyme
MLDTTAAGEPSTTQQSGSTAAAVGAKTGLMSADRSEDSSPEDPSLHIHSNTSTATTSATAPDLSAYTGIVVVGGDGMLFEVMQVVTV